MKMWVSRHALKNPPREIEIDSISNGWASTLELYGQSFKVGVDIHHTREDADAAVRKKRQDRLAFLRKQIAELEALEHA